MLEALVHQSPISRLLPGMVGLPVVCIPLLSVLGLPLRIASVLRFFPLPGDTSRRVGQISGPHSSFLTQPQLQFWTLLLELPGLSV